MSSSSNSVKSNLLVGKNKEFQHNYEAINAQFPDETADTSILAQIRTYIGELMLFPVMMLVTATATERITFKITVDRMLPYQFVLVEIIFFLSSVVFGAMTAYKQKYTQEITEQMKQFPHSKILIMASIDTFQFIMLVFSASEVSPTMSVLLMHASTLLIYVGSMFTFPNRKYSAYHKYGVILMSLAMAVCMFKITANYLYGFYTFVNVMCGYLYIIAAALQGFSTLYKERSIIEWSQPIDIYYLSSWLFFYQFLITFGVSLLYYVIREICGHKLKVNPFMNVVHGLECFLGVDPDPNDHIGNNCSESLWVIIGFVLSNFFVLYYLGKVLQLSNQVVGRAMALAIFVAFIVLWAYDIYINNTRGNFYLSSNVGLCDISAIIILLVGMEIYGRDPEPDEELITNFVPPSVGSSSSKASEKVPSPAYGGGGELASGSTSNNSSNSNVSNFIPIKGGGSSRVQWDQPTDA